jgi:protein TonB
LYHSEEQKPASENLTTAFMKNKGILLTITLLTISILCVSQTAVKSGSKPIDYSGKIYATVEEEACFPGGDSVWQKYLEENLQSATPIKNGAPNETYQIMVRFIVSTDGTITNVSPITKFGYGIEDEVIRAIKMGPKWIPAVQKGKSVNSFKKQQVTFIIKTK